MTSASDLRYQPTRVGGRQTSDLVMSLKNQSGELELGPNVTNMKIPDSMIRCLPKFDYTQIARENFLKSFARMLKSTGAVYLMHNVKREIKSSDSSTATSTPGLGQGIFSPSKDRKQYASVMRGDDHATAGGFTVNPQADEAKTGSVGTGIHSPTAEVSQSRQPPQQPAAFVTPMTSAASQRHTTSRSSADDQRQAAVQSALHLSAPQGSPSAFMPRPQSSTMEFAFAQQAPTVEEGAFPNPPQFSREALSTVGEYSDDDVDEESASSYELMSEHDPEQVEMKYERRQRTGQGESAVPQAAPPNDPGLTLREINLLEQLEFQKQRAADTDSRLSRMEQMYERQIAGITAQFQMMQSSLAASQHTQQGTSAPASTPSDDAEKLAIVQQRLIADFSETTYWWSAVHQRKENAHETMLRARIFLYLVRILPGELHRRVDENDVLAIYHNIVMVNCPTQSQQETDLRGRISNSRKGHRGMSEWLDELYDLVDQLEKIGCTVQEHTVRTVIIESLKADKRYYSQWRKVLKKKEWQIATIRSYLEAEAQLIGDLVVSKSHKIHKIRMAKADDKKRARRNKAKANKAEATYAQALKAVADAKKEQAVLKALIAAKQRAHGERVEEKRKSRAEKPPLDAKRREQLKNELCPFYLASNCNRGDACPRKHQSLDQIRRLAGRKKAGGDQPRHSEKNDGPLGMCHQWMANGACSFGDHCKFSHDPPPPMGKMARYYNHLN